MVARIGSWQDKHLQLKCGREAVKLIKEYINNGKISWANSYIPKWSQYLLSK